MPLHRRRSIQVVEWSWSKSSIKSYAVITWCPGWLWTASTSSTKCCQTKVTRSFDSKADYFSETQKAQSQCGQVCQQMRQSDLIWRSDADPRDSLFSSEWNIQLDWWTGVVPPMVVQLLPNSTCHSNWHKFLVLRRSLWNARRNTRNSIEHITVSSSSFAYSQRDRCHEERVFTELLFGQLLVWF